MSNLIQIKRSTTTAVPVSLANGEFAYTSNGEILYIGSNGSIVPIAGKRFPGVLTANQALIANASSGIDKIIVANLVATVVTANSTLGGSGQVLTSNSTGGVYWGSVAGTGTITQINTGNGLTGGPITSSGTIAVIANSGIIANSTGVYVLANSGITSNSTGVYVTPANGIFVSSTGVQVTGANGVSVTSSGVNVLAGNTQLVSNSTGLWVNQSNIDHNSLSNYDANRHIDHTAVSITAGNGLSGGGTIAATRTLTVAANTNAGLVANSTSLNAKVGVGVFFDGSGNVAIGQWVNTTSSVTFANVVTTDITVSGNLVVSGTLTTVDATNLVVNDSIISLGRNNGANALDIGFYGQYNDGTERFTGLIWDTSAGVYELFANTITEPTTTLDTAATGYVRSTLRSYLNTGALVANLTNVSITANSTVAVAIVANTISLSTALPLTSGGTGLNSITSGDILVGNTGNTLSKLTAGADGYVLQMAGTSVTWGGIDGGTF